MGEFQLDTKMKMMRRRKHRIRRIRVQVKVDLKEEKSCSRRRNSVQWHFGNDVGRRLRSRR